MYDIIIVGAGPAGLTAAIYARRAGKSVLLLERESFGGQMTFSPKVENYPGFSPVPGSEIASRMAEQALSLGADAETENVLGIRDAGYTKYVMTDCGEHEAKSVILAIGTRHRRLGLPGEEDLIGHGVSFCAVCDGAFYAGKTVAVVGGGNSALQEALLLAETCERVYVIQNLPTLTGEESLRNLLLARPNVTVLCQSLVEEYIGDTELRGIIVRREGEDTLLKITLDGVFLAVGLMPVNDAFADTVALDARGYIVSDEKCGTDCAGVFVAGDCRTKEIRQITTAAADGAIAAVAACKYIDSFS